jgi:hypothetical protein
MNPVEPGQPAQPVKVGASLTGEFTVAPFAGELKAIFVQPPGVGVAVGAEVRVGGAGVGGGVALTLPTTLIAASPSMPPCGWSAPMTCPFAALISQVATSYACAGRACNPAGVALEGNAKGFHVTDPDPLDAGVIGCCTR